MHADILSDKQKEVLPYLAGFKRSFYLAGGTAIALHLGHRQSIDFDMFTLSKINKHRIKEKIWQIPLKKRLIFEDVDQIHVYINDVRVTFFQYPYSVRHLAKLGNVISLPSLLSLAAMKAFALGRRAKWKDYVDLYFIIKNFYPIKEIAAEAEAIFDTQFSEKLFREQLSFHRDIDYSEGICFFSGFETSQNEIREFLTNVSIEIM